MKFFLPHAALATALVIGLSGCGKKQEVQPQGSQGSQQPDGQQTPVPQTIHLPTDAGQVAAAPAAPGQPTRDADLLKEPSPGSKKPGAPAEDAVDPTQPNRIGDVAAYEAWFKKYHLDLNDPKMLDADPDGDGFTNREEFLAGTDPLDPNSHPPIVAARSGIKLKEYNEIRLPVVLEAVDGDKARLRRVEQGEGKVETVKTGDTVRGLPLTVEHVESRHDVDKNGEAVDFSKVTLLDSATKEKVILMKDLPAKTSASNAVLSSPDGKTSLKVHLNDVFTWPGETGVTYRVLDMSRDQVVLQQVETKKTWTIPRM